MPPEVLTFISANEVQICPFLADRTVGGRAYGTLCRLSVCRL